MRLTDADGASASSVTTTLATPRTQPGGVLSGEVRLTGGDAGVAIDRIGLGLVTSPHEAGGRHPFEEFSRAQVSGPVALRPGAEEVIAFQVAVPWGTPVSEIGGRHLAGMALGVRTEVEIGAVVRRSDPDLVAVRPVPSQLRVLQAFARLGFPVDSAVLRPSGEPDGLSFLQKIKFYPPDLHAGVVHEVDVTFAPSSSGLVVVLEADQQAGHGPRAERFVMSHEEALRTDWPSEIDRWLVSRPGRGAR
ncbi:sporulation protein [Nonomuraea sp. NN258]|uniref:sporulation protein n=1 Tax=Nonomuraea antri TaxID=2730852 RepID=UPI0015699DE5|nr:sporulation protein [Nonomuraea antri]NRQ37672.1 sporulation protein [Nonomuraea antri]